MFFSENKKHTTLHGNLFPEFFGWNRGWTDAPSRLVGNKVDLADKDPSSRQVGSHEKTPQIAKGGEPKRMWPTIYVSKHTSPMKSYGYMYVCMYVYILGGGNSNILLCSTLTWGKWFPFWQAYFSDGLKPPTSEGFFGEAFVLKGELICKCQFLVVQLLWFYLAICFLLGAGGVVIWCQWKGDLNSHEGRFPKPTKPEGFEAVGQKSRQNPSNIAFDSSGIWKLVGEILLMEEILHQLI